MKVQCIKQNHWAMAIVMFVTLCPGPALADAPKTAKEFAEQYMTAFNHKDKETLKKLRFPLASKSQAQEFIDGMLDAEMEAGAQYQNFEILPVSAKDTEPQKGPDGKMYKPNLKPVNILKMTSETKTKELSTKSSTSFPIGEKDGVFYQVSIEPAASIQ